MDQTALAATADADRATDRDDHDADLVEAVEVVEELLIEEISIDGMCGVY
jgi:mycofactocin precursor